MTPSSPGLIATHEADVFIPPRSLTSSLLTFSPHAHKSNGQNPANTQTHAHPFTCMLGFHSVYSGIASHSCRRTDNCSCRAVARILQILLTSVTPGGHPKARFTTFQLLYATIISADGRRLMQVI